MFKFKEKVPVLIWMLKVNNWAGSQTKSKNIKLKWII